MTLDNDLLTLWVNRPGARDLIEMIHETRTAGFAAEARAEAAEALADAAEEALAKVLESVGKQLDAIRTALAATSEALRAARPEVKS